MQILEHLSHDTLPDAVIHDFVDWCIWQLAKPAYIDILNHTLLQEQAENIGTIEGDATQLGAAARQIGETIRHQKTETSSLERSTAEAASFLMQKIADAASSTNFDPEGIAFFTAQVCGWQGFAAGNFTETTNKNIAETTARQQQAKVLENLWTNHPSSD